MGSGTSSNFQLSLAPRLALLFALGGSQGLVGWCMVKSGLEVPSPPVKSGLEAPSPLTVSLTVG